MSSDHNMTFCVAQKLWLCFPLNNVLYSVSCFRELATPHGHLADLPMVCCQYELYTISTLLDCVLFCISLGFTFIYLYYNSFMSESC